MHDVSPLASWYFPAEHRAHTLTRSLGVMVPGAQTAGAVAPAAHADPAGQSVQSLWAVPPDEPRNVPAAHDLIELAPAGQTEPGGHAVHAVAPDAS